ncbi:MAG: uroporphyrinogen-III C-methyltransferase [Alteromonadaceae bacterium]|nr:uroporphyrinogen-III C-methyltransferase [Alteromonadaceae bacterium]
MNEQKKTAPDAEQRKADAIKLINKQRAEQKSNEEKPVTKSTAKAALKKDIKPISLQPKKSKIAVLALTVALLSAAGVGGLFYWQQLQVNHLTAQFSQQLNQKLSQQSQQQQLANKTQTQKLLITQRQQVNQQINAEISKIDASQQAKMSQLETALTRIAQRKPSDWLVHESQYLIRVALRSLWLEHNTPSAISLLKDADQRLQSLNSPQYLSVRQAINQDITALQLLPKLTTDNTILTLMGLAQQIDKLPLTKIKGIDDNDEESFQLSENTADWKENLARSWHKFIDEFITIRRQDNAVVPLMSPQYQQNLRENLSLKLQLAQWAASQGKTALYQQALDDIKQWQQQYFAMDNALNVNFQQGINKLKQAVIAIALPKTLASLTAIEQLMATKQLNTPLKVSSTVPTSVKNSSKAKAVNQSKPSTASKKPVKSKIDQAIDKNTNKNEAL